MSDETEVIKLVQNAANNKNFDRTILYIFRCIGQARSAEGNDCRSPPTTCGFGAPAVPRSRAPRLLPHVHGPAHVAPSEWGIVAPCGRTTATYLFRTPSSLIRYESLWRIFWGTKDITYIVYQYLVLV